MARITEIFLVDALEQNAVVVHKTVNVTEVPATIGEVFVKLFQYVRDQRMIPTDTPFLKIVGSNSNEIEVIIGLSIPTSLPGCGEISNYVIPSGKRVYSYWQGDNSDMTSIYNEMTAFVIEQGYEPVDGVFEYYLSGPEHGMDKLLTKVVILIA